MSTKPGARETQRAEKEADVIMASLARASEAATATTLASITGTLRNNTPLMYHIHALLQNDEWRGVLEAAARGHAAPVERSGDKPDKDKKLRTNLKKFEHLPRQRQRQLEYPSNLCEKPNPITTMRDTSNDNVDHDHSIILNNGSKLILESNS